MSWDGLNRRKFSRVFFPCLIKVRDHKEALLTHTENISSGGVRLILKKPLDMSAHVEVELDLMDADEPLRCVGKVVWVDQRKPAEPVKPLYYDIGIEFVGVSAEETNRLEIVVAHHLKQGKVVQ